MLSLVHFGLPLAVLLYVLDLLICLFNRKSSGQHLAKGRVSLLTRGLLVLFVEVSHLKQSTRYTLSVDKDSLAS